MAAPLRKKSVTGTSRFFSSRNLRLNRAHRARCLPEPTVFVEGPPSVRHHFSRRTPRVRRGARADETRETRVFRAPFLEDRPIKTRPVDIAFFFSFLLEELPSVRHHFSLEGAPLCEAPPRNVVPHKWSLLRPGTKGGTSPLSSARRETLSPPSGPRGGPGCQSPPPELPEEEEPGPPP